MHPPHLVIVFAAISISTAFAADRLIVHEWGTFTSFQDEAGQTIGGINSDDEPVPVFVHDIAKALLAGAGGKGGPLCHPHVTMRLETPVIYFHRPAPATDPITLDVQVSLRGGWLTQFYPYAESKAPGLSPASATTFGPLAADTTSSLAWKSLQIGGKASGPDTTDRVWTAPRAVRADAVQTANGESERFLFYRGVGNIDCPLRAVRSADGQSLQLHSNVSAALTGVAPLRVPHLWLVEVSDGGTAYRELPPIGLSSDRGAVVTEMPATFDRAAFSTDAAAGLRQKMHAALVAEGLFPDEAAALLETWKLSYFTSPGLRLFFIVPNEWTNQQMPLKVSVPADTTRVMVGRLELVTPKQRELLATIAANSTDPTTTNTAFSSLGRFRHALLLHELKRRPTPALQTLVADRADLKPYDVGQ